MFGLYNSVQAEPLIEPIPLPPSMNPTLPPAVVVDPAPVPMMNGDGR